MRPGSRNSRVNILKYSHLAVRILAIPTSSQCMWTQVSNPPICQKPYTLPLKHYSLVQQEIKALECVGSHQKEYQPLGQPNSSGTQEISTWWSPEVENVHGFPENKWTTAKAQRVDKQMDTQGNIALIPLPKIDEMYTNLHGAKMFTTLDLWSGYYHIALDNESKEKTVFVTPFGKYEFNAVPFGLV